MGMANEIEQLEYAILLIKQDGKDYLDERDIPILETAIETMRKYQTIKEIIADWKSDGGAFEMSELYWLGLISEEVEGGDNN